MTNRGLGDISGSKATPQARSGLGRSGYDPGRIRCHWCGVFTSPVKASFHFIPDSEFGPEEAWWECRGVCERQFARATQSTGDNQ